MFNNDFDNFKQSEFNNMFIIELFENIFTLQSKFNSFEKNQNNFLLEIENQKQEIEKLKEIIKNNQNSKIILEDIKLNDTTLIRNNITTPLKFENDIDVSNFNNSVECRTHVYENILKNINLKDQIIKDLGISEKN